MTVDCFYHTVLPWPTHVACLRLYALQTPSSLKLYSDFVTSYGSGSVSCMTAQS